MISSHINNATSDLLFASMDRNGTWEFTALDTAIDSGDHSSLINYFGQPVIAYYGGTDIKMAIRQLNGTWEFRLIDEDIPPTSQVAMTCVGGHTLAILHNDVDDPAGLRVSYGTPESAVWLEEQAYLTSYVVYYADIERVDNSLHIVVQDNVTLKHCHKAAECIVSTPCEILSCDPINDECDFTEFPDNCSYYCEWIECGNNRLDPTEECEYTLTPENCTLNCTWSVCGNLIVEPGEECDGSILMCSVNCTTNYLPLATMIAGIGVVTIIGFTVVGIGIVVFISFLASPSVLGVAAASRLTPTSPLTTSSRYHSQPPAHPVPPPIRHRRYLY